MDSLIVLGTGDMHSILYLEAGGGSPAALYEFFNFITPANGGASAAFYNSGLGGNYQDGSNLLLSNMPSNAMPSNGSTDAAGTPLSCCALSADDIIGSGYSSAPNGTINHIMFCEPNTMLHYAVSRCY